MPSDSGVISPSPQRQSLIQQLASTACAVQILDAAGSLQVALSRYYLDHGTGTLRDYFDHDLAPP